MRPAKGTAYRNTAPLVVIQRFLFPCLNGMTGGE